MITLLINLLGRYEKLNNKKLSHKKLSHKKLNNKLMATYQYLLVSIDFSQL